MQENIEAVARSQPAPGLGAITGLHWAAPLVHFYVSPLLACVPIAGAAIPAVKLVKEDDRTVYFPCWTALIATRFRLH